MRENSGKRGAEVVMVMIMVVVIVGGGWRRSGGGGGGFHYVTLLLTPRLAFSVFKFLFLSHFFSRRQFSSHQAFLTSLSPSLFLSQSMLSTHTHTHIRQFHSYPHSSILSPPITLQRNSSPGPQYRLLLIFHHSSLYSSYRLDLFTPRPSSKHLFIRFLSFVRFSPARHMCSGSPIIGKR